MENFNQSTNIGYVQGVPIESFIPLYPFCIVVGMIVSILTVAYFWRKEGYPIELLLKIIIITIPSAIIGARLFFVFERLIYNPENPFPGSHWYAIWEGGLSIHGGVILPAIFNLIFVRRHRNILDIRKTLGMILPTVLIGQAIGRWGNFANHEVYGKIVDEWEVSWLGPFISSNMYIADSAGAAPAFRVPLFLYESISSIIGYIVIVWVLLNFGLVKPGVPAALYLIWYGITRTAMEPLREESYAFYTILSVISIIMGCIIGIYFHFQSFKIYNIEIIGRTRNYISKNQSKPQQLVVTGKRWINE
ncbi:MAG: prolipoprotein diacylglyceryl transferase [Metamycoplasmataceae bacterium]